MTDDDVRRLVKTPECRGCGRIYIDRQWRYQINVTPDEVAICPACIRAEEERDELLRLSNRRKAAAHMRQGYGPTPDAVGLWRGFRNGE